MLPGTELRPDCSPERELLKLACMDNLLSSLEERVYFKALLSRFVLVSAGWVAAAAPGRTADEFIGLTDFDVFGEAFAAAALEDEQQVIRTGQPVVGKLERETFGDRPGAWVSTTKMPLRDANGQIIGTFGLSRDVTAQITAENTLAYQARHDPVTGLANRIALMERLAQALVAMEADPAPLAVLFIDLDNFKVINDSYGHGAGDNVLAEVGRRLSAVARRADTVTRHTVGRLGGDEFVLLCGDLRDDNAVCLIGDRIVRSIGTPYLEGGRDLSVTGSVGIVVTHDPLAEPEQLVRDADAAMYEAKKAGRNRFQVYSHTEPGPLPVAASPVPVDD